MKNPSEGMKFDSDKPDYSLVPFAALDEVVKVLTYGAKKYDRFNWEKVERHRYEAAALRHISAYMQGEKYDPETDINHLAHAVCSLLFLTQFDLNEKNEKKPKSYLYNNELAWYNSINTITGDDEDQPTTYTVNLNGTNYETK